MSGKDGWMLEFSVSNWLGVFESFDLMKACEGELVTSAVWDGTGI